MSEITNSVMLDRVIAQIQIGLAGGLPWLDVAFGRAQRLVRMMNGKRIVTPNVYCGGWRGHGENDYIEVSPDSHIGNFSFVWIDDPQIINGGGWARSVKTPFAIIFWMDLRKVYDGQLVNRNVEYLKAQVLNVLSGQEGWKLDEGRVTVQRIYELPENIYRGFPLSEIDNQYLMHPYAGFRIEGLLEYDELCWQQAPEAAPANGIAYRTEDGLVYVIGDKVIKIDGNA